MIKISNKELIEELTSEPRDFPLYTTQIINLANQNSQGTRPNIVGKLSDLIQECPEKTYKGWKVWYLTNHPDTITNATERIHTMVEKLRLAIEKIDKKMVKKWVEDLVLEKTFIGLRLQEAIIKKVAKLKNKDYRISSPQEESRGIDGFIGGIAVSVKPISYSSKKSLQENIYAKIIFYEKKKDGLRINADGVLNE